MEANNVQPTQMRKDMFPTEKLIICETVVSGLAIRIFHIVIGMSIAENGPGYRAVIGGN
jgi:hypothetical protein